MSESDYKILVSDALKRQLDGLDAAGLRIIREKLEFLAAGLWEGGLRVKKMQCAEGRAVFEARMSSGDRLLFTLGRDRSRSIIYAWGIEAHDDVSRACRSVLPENAPFLSFEPLSVEELPALPADEGDCRYFTQGGVDGDARGDYGPQRWRVLEDPDWERLLASAAGQRAELRLYLTQEQLGFLEQSPPLFISGTAGSGKTTLALYCLLRPLPEGGRRLFVTKHPGLCRLSRELYEGLAAGREETATAPRPRFSTFRELLLEIVASPGVDGSGGFDSSREVDYPTFERMIGERREFASLDPELAWEEIRGVIKGAARQGLGDSGPLLSLRDYQALGRKRAPRFALERDLVYAAAEWYEGRLRAEGLWDEIDLARRALDILSLPRAEGRGPRPWDLLVCDEAQDLTGVHILLLLSLVADPSQVVMAGDVKQITDPSGFRWADLRGLFWERGLRVPELFRLSLNFRSAAGIVKVGNALLELKRRLAGIQSEETSELWNFAGMTPSLICGLGEDCLASELARPGLGARASAAIIVRDAATRERLRALLGSSLVFTVAECKGLEFDSVLVWNLSSGPKEIAALWRRLAGDDRLSAGHEARIIHEANLYYVAVTRARSRLVVCERSPHFWERAEFEGLFVSGSDPELLRSAWRELSTPGEWAKQGEYYLDRGFWRAAAECFRNAGDPGRQGLALARALFAERRFSEAILPLEAASLLRDAALACEETLDFRRASALWKEEGEALRSTRCLARALERERAFAAAAAAWLELGDREAALRDLESAGDSEAVARLCRSMRQWPRAAAAYAACGRHAAAAACWRRAGEHEKAADAYWTAEDWRRASACYARATRSERVCDCWLKAGLYEKAARVYLERHEIAKAISAFRQLLIARPSEAPRLSFETRGLMKTAPLNAAAIISAFGESALAGDIFLTLGERGLALAEFRATGDKAKVASLLEAQGDYLAAALETESESNDSRDTPESQHVVQLLERHIRRGQEHGRVDRGLAIRLAEEARVLEAKGEVSHAVNRYVVLGLCKEARRCFLQLDRDDLAFNFYCNIHEFDELAAYIRDKRKFRMSHDRLMFEAERLSASGWTGELLPRWPYLIDALSRFRSEADLANEDFRRELEALLPIKDMEGYALLADMRHLAALDLLLRIGHTDEVMLIWRHGLYNRRASGPYAREFDSRLEAAALEGPKAPWFRVFHALVRYAVPDFENAMHCLDIETAILLFVRTLDGRSAEDIERLEDALGVIRAERADGVSSRIGLPEPLLALQPRDGRAK